MRRKDSCGLAVVYMKECDGMQSTKRICIPPHFFYLQANLRNNYEIYKNERTD